MIYLYIEIDMAENKTKEFLARHKPMKPDDIEKSFVSAEKSREKYSKDIIEIESNLTRFFQKEDPIIDPGTGKVLAWVREAPLKELQIYALELQESVEKIKPEDLQRMLNEDPELIKKQYALMANLIVKPKHDAEWWAEHATQDFFMLFEITLEKMTNKGMNEANFSSLQTTDMA